jgi:hypothetical protein
MGTGKKYIQVFIKTEADLPTTERGIEYWAHIKSDRIIKTDVAWTWRVHEIDWYLLPEPEEPTNKDIGNAATDYVNNHYLNGRLTTIKQKVHKAYETGAIEMRDKKIYISPKIKTS